MGYRIQYEPVHKRNVRSSCSFRRHLLCALCFAIFLFWVDATWPEGAALLKRPFTEAGHAITVSALDRFAAELQHGQNIVIAVGDFFRNLLSL